MHVFENGIHDIPNAVYHGSLGLSRSALWEFKRSPWHYWHKYLNPNREKEEPTPAMKMGEYVHTLVLEPQHFNERFAVKPILEEVPKVGLLKELGRDEYDRQKATREIVLVANEIIMDEFLKDSIDKDILSLEAYTEAKTIADAVLKDPIAQALFTDVEVEKSIYFTHKHTGLQCKVRPDAWAGSVVTDLKTCSDASFDAFRASALRGGYFLQAAMIKQALESLGIELEKFVFYCVEKTPAMPCVHYTLDEISLLKAEAEFNELMYGIADCMETNRWRSYEPQNLTYPLWA